MPDRHLLATIPLATGQVACCKLLPAHLPSTLLKVLLGLYFRRHAPFSFLFFFAPSSTPLFFQITRGTSKNAALSFPSSFSRLISPTSYFPSSSHTPHFKPAATDGEKHSTLWRFCRGAILRGGRSDRQTKSKRTLISTCSFNAGYIRFYKASYKSLRRRHCRPLRCVHSANANNNNKRTSHIVLECCKLWPQGSSVTIMT